MSSPAVENPRNAESLGDRVRSLRMPAPQRGVGGARLPWAVSIVLAGVCLWLAYQVYGRTQPSAVPAANVPAPPVAVSGVAPKSPGEKAVVSGASGDIALESKGYIVPAHQILVSPKVSGMIVSLQIAEGRHVEKNAVLAELEKTDYESDRDRAAAALMQAEALRDRAQARVGESIKGFRDQEKLQAEADLEEARVQLPQMESEQKRYAELLQKGAVTEQQYETVDSRLLAHRQRIKRLEASVALMQAGEREERRAMARFELDQAEAAIKLAQAEVAKAQWRLDNTTIRAPISGTILRKNAEEGNVVNPIAFNGSFSLCEMADLSDLEVELNVQERDISQVFVGQQCRVRADAFPDRTYEGSVDRLMPIADRAKASIPVRVKLRVPKEEQGVYLKPEMSVQVTFMRRAEVAAVK